MRNSPFDNFVKVDNFEDKVKSFSRFVYICQFTKAPETFEGLKDLNQYSYEFSNEPNPRFGTGCFGIDGNRLVFLCSRYDTSG